MFSKICEANGAGYQDSLGLGGLSFMQYWKDEIPTMMSDEVIELPFIWNARRQSLLEFTGVPVKTADKIIGKYSKSHN